MFADYQAEVLQTYHHKKADNALSLNLIHPTPANLRNECEAVIDKRFLKSDLNTLRSFFGDHVDATAFVKAIRKFDVDLLRPLDNYLKGKVKDTNEKNVELLAWLIDYEPRPYQPDKSIAIAGSKGIVGEPMVEKERFEKLEATAKGGFQLTRAEKKSPLSKNRIAVILVSILVLVGGGYAMWSFAGGQQGCMIWTGEHYQPVSCSQQHSNVMVLALDTVKVAHFKKITRLDTITLRALGRVWYLKTDGEVEFFTSGGFHPVHTERRLHPVTIHIIQTYAH
ncbi:MAG TPA: hypothetical protein VK668_19380 [Mucilaginibacter sp.]|nr:hypothetical protein [Mucilaginibacter sp.]